MGFVDRLRMNGIFGNSMQPPDLDMGSDMSGLLRTIIPFIRKKEMDDYNQKNNQFPAPRPMLDDVARGVVNQPNQPTNRVNTGFMVDGMTPFEHASLQQRKREFEGKNTLGRDTLEFKKSDAAEDNQLGRDKLDVTQNKNTLDAENKAKRTAIYDFKAKNPGMKFIAVKGGNYMFADPITGDMHDSGIPSGTMTREDEIELQGQQRVNAIKQTGKNQLANIAANVAGRKDIAQGKQVSDFANIAERGRQSRLTADAKGEKDELPTQARVRQLNAARELINTRPELAPFIKFDQDGAFSLISPGTGFMGKATGPTKDQFEEIKKKIYGETPTYKTEDKIPAKNVSEDKPPTAPKGWKYVKKPGGGWTAVEDK